MILRGTFLWATVTSLILAGGTLAGRADTTNAPDFKEVYDLLRAHLPGATDASLNQTAVAGLLAELKGRAELINDSTVATTSTNLVKASVLENTVAWLRVSRVTDDLAASLRAASQAVTVSNKLAGTILDLRFTPGDAYTAVKDSAAVLMSSKMPLVVLVNGATSGAAELLAAELREGGALLLGNPTAGLAMTTEDFPLANGEHLRVATTPIKLHGNDLTRVVPDITIKVDPAQELALMNDPYGPVAPADNSTEIGTNDISALLDHTSEADLVRQKRKDGDGDENPEPPAKAEPPRPVLRDPVLARAVDLVEGLAVMRESHP
jgi:hypothetical protein